MTNLRRYLAVSLFAVPAITVLAAGQRGPTTELSKKAATVEPFSSTRAAVVALLGPPTWAILPTDKDSYAIESREVAYELRWRNTPCYQIVVSFTAANISNGLDAGFVCTRGGYPPPDPPTSTLCTRPDRLRYCRAN